MVQPLTIDQIEKNLIADRFWRERRHPQITLNYELARDTVIVNRLTQRQSVNVPYMKKTLVEAVLMQGTEEAEEDRAVQARTAALSGYTPRPSSTTALSAQMVLMEGRNCDFSDRS